MKGKIGEHIPFKSKDYYLYREYYTIRYIPKDKYEEGYIHILKEDMAEFMDDIQSQYMKLIWEKKQKLARNQMLKEMVENVWGKSKIKVITKQEEAEQDRDELEMDIKELEDLSQANKARYLTGYQAGYEDRHKNKPYRFKKDKDEQEIQKTFEEMAKHYEEVTKTYNNFPTDEQLEYDINIRERD